MEGQLNCPATGAATPLAELSNLQANISPTCGYFTILFSLLQHETFMCG